MNPRPPRCERGALPAELLPHLRAGKHSRRFPLELSRKGEGRSFVELPDGRVALCASRCGQRGEPLATIKFFPALPIKSSGRQSASGGSALLPRRRNKYRVVKRTIGEDNVTTGSLVRKESPALPRRSVARVFTEFRAGRGLAPHAAAPDSEPFLTERAFFGYRKPSPRD